MQMINKRKNLRAPDFNEGQELRSFSMDNSNMDNSDEEDQALNSAHTWYFGQSPANQLPDSVEKRPNEKWESFVGRPYPMDYQNKIFKMNRVAPALEHLVRFENQARGYNRLPINTDDMPETEEEIPEGSGGATRLQWGTQNNRNLENMTPWIRRKKRAAEAEIDQKRSYLNEPGNGNDMVHPFDRPSDFERYSDHGSDMEFSDGSSDTSMESVDLNDGSFPAYEEYDDSDSRKGQSRDPYKTAAVGGGIGLLGAGVAGALAPLIRKKKKRENNDE